MKNTDEPPIDWREDSNARFIPLGNGRFAIVDASDYESVARFKWHLIKPGKNEYASGRPNGKRCTMHTFIARPKSGIEIDHWNTDGLDNRRANFRYVTHQQNHFNSRKLAAATSSFKGVYKNTMSYATTRWEVSIKHNYKRIWIGAFKSETEAAKAYDKKARELFGTFALCNFGK